MRNNAWSTLPGIDENDENSDEEPRLYNSNHYPPAEEDIGADALETSPLVARAQKAIDVAPVLVSNDGISPDKVLLTTGVSNSRWSRTSNKPLPDHVDVAKEVEGMMDDLKRSLVPGPQLFRLTHEFTETLGAGGEGVVRGTNAKLAEDVRQLRRDRVIRSRWLAERIAIKSHGPRACDSCWKSYLLAARAEIRALVSSSRTRGHPHIVQLLGWGLCLDVLEHVDGPLDGLHDPSSFPLQLPLLVLERAEGDMEQLLQDIFAYTYTPVKKGRAAMDPESRAEQGLSPCSNGTARESESLLMAESQGLHALLSGVGELNCPNGAANEPLRVGETRHTPLSGDRPGASRPREQDHGYGSFSSSTTVWGSGSSNRKACEDGHKPKSMFSRPKRTREFWIGAQVDPYEVVRRLCIDIGHGLHGLHELDFTHGDLKPQNVLIFRDRFRLTAKLCDFGFSEGAGNATVPASLRRAKYYGTDGWVPKWFSTTEVDLETLRKYDLTVYGLLVWSSFFHRGNAPPLHETTDETMCALEDDIAKYLKDSVMPAFLPGGRAHLARRVRNLIHCTVATGSCEAHNAATLNQCPQHLNRVPWRHLYGTRDLLAWKMFEGGRYSPWHEMQSSQGGTGASQRPQSEVLAQPSVVLPNNSTRQRLLSPETKREWQWLVQKQYSALSLRQRKMQVRELYLMMQKAVAPARRTQMDRTNYPFLYGAARLRGCEVLLSDWQLVAHPPTNILEGALRNLPYLDICTLAWLCQGDVGVDEVRTLPSVYKVWQPIVDPRCGLNDSERLERFVLLLQFGARVEARLKWRTSIICCFLRSCRPAVLPTAAAVICRRFKATLTAAQCNDRTPERIADSTRHYLTGDAGAEAPVLRDLRHVSPLWSGDVSELVEAEFAQLQPDSGGGGGLLPEGWHSLGREKAFREAVTGSITLRRPSFAPEGLQSVPIGFVRDRGRFSAAAAADMTVATKDTVAQVRHKTKTYCHPVVIRGINITDLAGCEVVDSDWLAREKQVLRRLAAFDENWFRSERDHCAPTYDVLAKFQDEGAVTSFARRIPQVNVSASLLGFFRRLAFFILELPRVHFALLVLAVLMLGFGVFGGLVIDILPALFSLS
ncbi:hypothetical protein F5Y19DRAFT_482326 [Xylariaceae sp. FL1651]|nr:hypothetical protein F5Y19DRAFT_482326 [Xylariaceae sp. FL1651]